MCSAVSQCAWGTMQRCRSQVSAWNTRTSKRTPAEAAGARTAPTSMRSVERGMQPTGARAATASGKRPWPLPRLGTAKCWSSTLHSTHTRRYPASKGAAEAMPCKQWPQARSDSLAGTPTIAIPVRDPVSSHSSIHPSSSERCPAAHTGPLSDNAFASTGRLRDRHGGGGGGREGGRETYGQRAASSTGHVP